MDKLITTPPFEDNGPPGYRPMVPTGSMEENPIPKIDFLGALWRRKSVVVLLAILGAAIAGLLFSQATPKYATVARLMIWMQAPPSVINGEVLQQQVALEKQKTFLSSQLVLEKAVKDGNLIGLKTFDDPDVHPIAKLRDMLSISPVGKDLTSDSLDVICEGTKEEELPHILASVVAAYIGKIKQDSEDSGEKSVELIEQLQQKLQEEQAAAESEYRALRTELTKDLPDANAEDESGKFINPYVVQLEKLKAKRDEYISEFRESDQLLEKLATALDPERESDDLLKLAVVEAKKYFNLNNREDSYAMLAYEDRARISRYEQRIETAYSEVLSLQAEREESAKRFGEKHPQVEFVDSKYQAALAAMNRLTEELDSMRSLPADGEGIAKKNEVALQDARSRDEELVRMYAAALTNTRERAKYLRGETENDISKTTEDAQKIAEKISRLNILQEKIQDRRNSVDQIFEKLSALRVMSQNHITTKVKEIDPPSAAEKVFPILWKFLLVGLLLGGLAGSGLAVLIDHSDLSYRTPIDIQESLNVPVVCKVPKIRKGKVEKDFAGSPMLISSLSPSSSAAETFRAARTSLLFAAGQTGHKVFMFTSPSPGDGKSTTVANLAISLAQTNKKVCLIDADYRRPRVQQNFGIQFEPGGHQYLLGEATLDEVLRPCEFQENLTLMTTGGRPKNPGELVASEGFANMILELRRRFDIVLIDSPPIIPVADSSSMAPLVDGVIMILRIRRGVILSAHKAKDRLDMVNANLMGVIVNGMDENVYYNEYGTYYRGAYYTGSGYSKYYDRQYSDYSDRPREKKKALIKSS